MRTIDNRGDLGEPARPGLSESEAQKAREYFADLIEGRLDELAATLTELYRESLPGYADVSRSSVRYHTGVSLEILIRGLRAGTSFDSEYVQAFTERARGWATTPLSLNSIARSCHILMRHLLQLVHLQGGQALSAAAMFEIEDSAWEWVAVSTAVIADVQQAHADALARRDASRLGAFLRDLSLGRLTDESLADEAVVHGLDEAHDYIAVVAPYSDAAEASAIAAEVRQSGTTWSHLVVLAAVDQRIVALAPQRPTAPEGATVGVGQPMPLGEMHKSFAEAREALTAAAAFGVTGVVDLEMLGPRTLVTSAEHAAARLVRRHFPDTSDSFREVERTVLTLLKHNQSIEDTAASLHMHRNTVRYRVSRFREKTGLDLRNTEDLVATGWLLNWRVAQRLSPRA